MDATNEHIVVSIINDVIDVVCEDGDVQYPAIVERGRKRKRDKKRTDQTSLKKKMELETLRFDRETKGFK